jgi:hypothetical protein
MVELKAISAEVIADSINTETGDRLTTFRIILPKFILAEFNTHRMISRNFSSSRAIPGKKLRSMVLKNPVAPVHWGANQKGMQAATELKGFKLWLAKKVWLWSRFPACAMHRIGESLGMHKQIVNRLIEPWSWAEGIVSGTEWENFFLLRTHATAQPEFRALAIAMKAALDASTPKPLAVGDWHIPLVDSREFSDQAVALNVSAARCARVSYFLREGKRSDVRSDVDLCRRLAAANPKHLSPFEHQAQAIPGAHANFRGFQQYRSILEQSVDKLF